MRKIISKNKPMVELKEKQAEKIKNTKDARSVEHIIDTSILEIKKIVLRITG